MSDGAAHIFQVFEMANKQASPSVSKSHLTDVFGANHIYWTTILGWTGEELQPCEFIQHQTEMEHLVTLKFL